MAEQKLREGTLAAAAVATLAGASEAAEQTERQAQRQAARQTLLTDIKSDDPDVRTKAWRNAGDVGAAALKPLANQVTKGEQEVSRAAKRAMWQIVRDAGNPASRPAKKKRTVAALLKLLAADQSMAVRREVLWMLSEIAGDEAVEPIATLLGHKDLREDARMVLDRIPGDASIAALQAGLEKAPEDFKYNLAQSLRHRGVEVPGLPCQKLVPKKTTSG